MAGTVTVTETTWSSVKKIYWVWLSTAGGAADKATTAQFDGLIERVAFIPGAAAAQPTDQYDVTISDSDGLDVLAGLGANLSNAATVVKTHADGLTAVAGSVLTLNVTNAGNAKGGAVVLYLR